MTTQPVRNGNRFAFTIVTALFFLWGFISCMNDLLIPKFKADFNLNQAQANLVQFALFGAYFLVSLAYFLISAAKGDPINKIGYKNGLVLGLLVAGMGCFLFYPAAETKQYPLFLGALIFIFMFYAFLLLRLYDSTLSYSLYAPQSTTVHRQYPDSQSHYRHSS